MLYVFVFFSYAVCICPMTAPSIMFSLQSGLHLDSLRHLSLGLALSWTYADVAHRGLFNASTILGWSRGRVAFTPFLLSITISIMFSGFDHLSNSPYEASELRVLVQCLSTAQVEGINDAPIVERDLHSNDVLSFSQDTPLCRSLYLSEMSNADPSEDLMILLDLETPNEQKGSIAQHHSNQLEFKSASASPPFKWAQVFIRLAIMALCFVFISILSRPYLIAVLNALTLLAFEVLMTALAEEPSSLSRAISESLSLLG